ncbi:MAG: M61 family metallopeptidase, partial [Gemmatimonadetes bacterium]|nr:M61 family metallopeptidase [Gemmatimonadota bacterium]
MRALRSLMLVAALPSVAWAQGTRYRVTVNPPGNTFVVRAELPVPSGRDTFLISLPAWSPGAYDIANYARFVHGFTASAPDGRPLFWDKADKDTWRIAVGGARQVVVEFRTNPDSIGLEWSAIGQDYAFFNGTNLLPYPEGGDLDSPAELILVTPDGWRVATGLATAGVPGRYRAASYHDLVDSPFLMGRLAIDSVIVDGRPIRFAVYPDSVLTPAVWDSVSDAIRRIATAQNRIFGGPPYEGYTVLLFAPFVEMEWAGGLEHHNSQFDAYAAPFFAPNRRTGRLGDFARPLLSHEFFHLWNVKRIRPAEMWPYDYAREQYTPLLWWSEGVTDYYGDVALARGGLFSVDRFIAGVNDNIREVDDAREIVAAEDASLNTWTHPTYVDESQYYYPKGSLLGLMLDIQIREGTNNQHSLDDVMR